MKTSQDPRHKKRERLVQELFSIQFHDQPVSNEALHILSHKKELDQKIHQAAPHFPVDSINKVDLAILRLALYELFFEKKVPKGVIIDEAIELSKKFANETSPAFINGVLGANKKTDE